MTQVKSSKFLHVHVYEHLTWNEHIRRNNTWISFKIAKSVGVISRIACLLSCNIRLYLYYSLVYTHTYPISISYRRLTTPPDWRDYTVLQARDVRIVAGRSSSSSYHTINKFYDLRSLVFEQINKLQVSEFMYHFTHKLLLSAFSSYFSNVSDIHSYYRLLVPSVFCKITYACVAVTTHSRVHQD